MRVRTRIAGVALAALTISSIGAAWYSYVNSRCPERDGEHREQQKTIDAEKGKADALRERDNAVKAQKDADFNKELSRLFIDGASDVGGSTSDGASGAALESISKLRAIADKGDDAAAAMLGAIYFKGLGAPRNEAEALRWYESRRRG